jgi:ribosomal protein S18 acetylase RimI-like enzyme
MQIREFDLERDYAAALVLWQASGPGVGVGVSDTREALALKLARDPDLFLIAEADGRLIGTVIGGWDGRRGMVYHLAVAAEARRAGVGTALMREVERRLQAKGCRKAYLLIVPGNEDVVNFYEANGWRRKPVTLLDKTFE